MKILANDGISESGKNKLEEYGFEVDLTKVSQEQLIKYVNDNQIAVITVEGVIMEGEIMQGVAGANGIVNQIRSAHEDENTKAIVFRVNSPGGSVIASEMMRDELIAAKRIYCNLPFKRI